MTDLAIGEPELVDLAALTPHPRNYRSHPADQVEEIAASIVEHGFYRNIVAATDLTILAGHGTCLAAELLGMTQVPVVRLSIEPDSPEALKVLAADNELARFAEDDDRVLTDLLKELSESSPTGLRGTGYDSMMLANLLMVTRDRSEIGSFDAAAEWVGMPDYEPENAPFKIVINFDNEADRLAFERDHPDIVLPVTKNGVHSGYWPPRGVRHDTTLKHVPVEAG